MLVRIIRLLSTVFWGLFAVLWVFPWVSSQRRLSIKRYWSNAMLRACGMRLFVHPAPDGTNVPNRGELVAMNHISFIDILALDSLRPAHFIAKSEIRSWPVVGTLCERTGTIFIERGRRHAVHSVLKTMSQELREGEVIAFFPEGTTSDGSGLLPFHANLFEAAVRSSAPIRPVLLSYKQYGGRSEVPAFIDDLTLIQCALAVLQASAIDVHLQVLDAIDSKGLTRHELAARVRTAMLACCDGS